MRLRHPIAAVLGVAGLVLGAVASFSGSATAAGDLTGTVTFSCVVTPQGGNPFTAYDYAGEITLTGGRPVGSSTVTVVARMSKMSGVSPVALTNAAFTNELVLGFAGTPTTLLGSGTVNAPANESFTMPDLQGTFQSSAASVAVTVASFKFKVTASGITMNAVCTPPAGAALGTLTLSEGTVPTLTPTPTPTTTTSATATPSVKPTKPTKSTGGSKSKGTPAKGKVTFSCVLNPLNSAFDYPATISVAGSREKAGDDVSLSAKMSDLPGISPVPIDGQMDVTLDLTVGGKKTTLKGGTHATAAPKAKVPVPTLTGSVAADKDELDVKVSGFTFTFAELSIDADCEADSVALSKMTVGSEPVDTGTDDPSPSTSTTTGGTTLPQTGGGDSMPVVALWALALTLLGVAGLLCVPRARRQH